MAKLTTKETKGGAQQYTRGGGEGEKSKVRIALDVTQDERPGRDASTAMSKEITKRYSTHALTLEDKVVAYCLPKYKELK